MMMSWITLYGNWGKNPSMVTTVRSFLELNNVEPNEAEINDTLNTDDEMPRMPVVIWINRVF